MVFKQYLEYEKLAPGIHGSLYLLEKKVFLLWKAHKYLSLVPNVILLLFRKLKEKCVEVIDNFQERVIEETIFY